MLRSRCCCVYCYVDVGVADDVVVVAGDDIVVYVDVGVVACGYGVCGVNRNGGVGIWVMQ